MPNNKVDKVSCITHPLCLIMLGLLFLHQACPAQDKPKTAIQYFDLGEEAMKNKNPRLALAHFNEAIRLEPFLWSAYYSRGLTRDRLGDTKGALTDLNIYLDNKPVDTEALFLRAVLRFQNGQWAVAREDFLKLMTLPQGETNTVYFETDKSNKVGKIFTTQSQSDARSTYLNYLGLIDLKLNQYKRSVTYFDSAISVSPKCADCHLNRGLAHLQLRDTTQAVKDFNKTLTIAPDNSLAQHNLALIAGFNGNLKQTETMLTEAIEQKPELPYSYSERGRVRLKQQNWKGALADFDKAISLDPYEADDWLNRGLTKEKMKDLTGAFSDITEAIKLKTNFEKAWLCRGNILVKMNRLTDAIEDYGLALFHYPEYGIAYYNRALAYHKLGKLKEACNDLKTAQGLDVKIERKVFDTLCK